MQGT